VSSAGVSLPSGLGGPVGDSETQTSQALSAILQMIERLELAPGATFTERELGESLGMGKGPVREALARICASELITPRTGSGYVVAPITLREARSLFDLWRCLERLAVESYALPSVAARATEVPLDTAFGPDAEGPGDAHLRAVFFHVGVASLSGNQPLFRALPYWEISRLLRFANGLVGQVVCSHDVHRELWQALLASDVERAMNISAEHIEDLKRRVLEGLATSDQIQDMNLIRPAGARTPKGRD
jgi:DNA-binding GntR family transcriptional regulator